MIRAAISIHQSWPMMVIDINTYFSWNYFNGNPFGKEYVHVCVIIGSKKTLFKCGTKNSSGLWLNCELQSRKYTFVSSSSLWVFRHQYISVFRYLGKYVAIDSNIFHWNLDWTTLFLFFIQYTCFNICTNNKSIYK